MRLKNSCLILAVIAVCLAGCKAKDLNPIAGLTTVAEWDVSGEHYKSANLSEGDDNLESESSEGYNSIEVRLGAKLSSTTTMKVVAYTQGSMQADELCVFVTHGSNQQYYSTGNDNKNITVTVKDGKYSISFDNISLRHYTGNTAQSDSTTTTGYMKWPNL